MAFMGGFGFLLLSVFAIGTTSGKQLESRQSPDYMAGMMQEMMSGVEPGQIELVCSLLCQDEGGDDNSEVKAALDSLSSRLGAVESMLTGVDTKVSAITPTRPEWAKKYPVYMVEDPSGHYELTHSQAVRMCEQSGGVIASQRILQVAFEHGMDWCSCGWVEEGWAGYPIQFPRDGCEKNLAPGLRQCTWQSTWNAWCLDTGF